jgi:hypothetical protein
MSCYRRMILLNIPTRQAHPLLGTPLLNTRGYLDTFKTFHFALTTLPMISMILSLGALDLDKARRQPFPTPTLVYLHQPPRFRPYPTWPMSVRVKTNGTQKPILLLISRHCWSHSPSSGNLAAALISLLNDFLVKFLH